MVMVDSEHVIMLDKKEHKTEVRNSDSHSQVKMLEEKLTAQPKEPNSSASLVFNLIITSQTQDLSNTVGN